MAMGMHWRASLGFCLHRPCAMAFLHPLPRLHLRTFITPPSLSTGPHQKLSGYCHTLPVAALTAQKEELHKGINKNNVDVVKRVLDQARKATTRRENFHSDFLTPPVVEDALLALRKLSDIKVVVQGGYPEAERCRLLVGHVDIMASAPDAIAALSITGNFTFDLASHGDFLGAVLGTGITREKVGDVLFQGIKGAQIIVVPELVDYIVSSVTQVRNVPVSCFPIPLLALEVQPPRTKVFKSVESSLRVDAIASAGFQISRTKLVDLIRSGGVRVNWNETTKNGTTLKTGDMISIIGKGRLQVGEIKPTKKGKFVVELIRHL